MTTEKLDIKLTLSGTFWRRRPEYIITIDGNTVANDLVNTESGVKFDLPFEATLSEDEEHTLAVRFINKTDVDCVMSEDKTEILKDMLLNVEGLEIDGIDVGVLLWENSVYTDLDGNTIDGGVNMGRNGQWEFKFSCPFYMWLLENM
jgi:hypothetical protein